MPKIGAGGGGRWVPGGGEGQSLLVHRAGDGKTQRGGQPGRSLGHDRPGPCRQRRGHREPGDQDLLVKGRAVRAVPLVDVDVTEVGHRVDDLVEDRHRAPRIGVVRAIGLPQYRHGAAEAGSQPVPSRAARLGAGHHAAAVRLNGGEQPLQPPLPGIAQHLPGALQSRRVELRRPAGRTLVQNVAPQPVALVGIDCKRGVELAPFAPRLSALATDPHEAAELLPVLVSLMEERYDLIRARQNIPPSVADGEITSDIWGLVEHERPVPVVVFVDEVAELFLTASRKDEERRDEMVTHLVRLAQLGRAAGIFLEVCGQRFGAELGKGATMLRAQLSGRVCHRVNDEASAKMALGDIAPEAVTAACAIPAERPGLAVAADTSGGWTRIRTPYLSLAEAAARCRDTAHLAPDIPALKPFAPGPVVESAT
ncbi:FtsK/SpoIIIE domain-containing protein [Streptomyces litchfieldiae]|uniref:FtsK/SpoIIIE domain-containing protein n=1 Tax=Streptomyces litchfieldiae TaxID=3075543 RepID=A0ABU2MRW3_9ACTN|nr:FtsK/SpoIIIE domain-containing protein [Streptomyces sp. DSM 44938]MDT0344373.1 FtsK/SpoIIIE domain-containing protein [Streptomyces sp. DSM 44938]